MVIKKMFDNPGIIAVVGDVNEAKSNLLYYLINVLEEIGSFKLYTYGLKYDIAGAIKFFSINELEQIRNSVVVIDELMSLWDLDNRMVKKQIESTLRLINHNNNILVICSLPENLKKFICGKINQYLFKKCTLSDFINGSKAGKICNNYKGLELGSSVLNIKKNEVLYYNGKHYSKIKVPYIEKFDSKKSNIKIVKLNKDYVN